MSWLGVRILFGVKKGVRMRMFNFDDISSFKAMLGPDKFGKLAVNEYDYKNEAKFVFEKNEPVVKAHTAIEDLFFDFLKTKGLKEDYLKYFHDFGVHGYKNLKAFMIGKNLSLWISGAFDWAATPPEYQWAGISGKWNKTLKNNTRRLT